MSFSGLIKIMISWLWDLAAELNNVVQSWFSLHLPLSAVGLQEKKGCCLFPYYLGTTQENSPDCDCLVHSAGNGRLGGTGA